MDTITKVLRAIADPTRREIFHALVLSAASLSITQIADQYEISRQGVTKHIKVLQSAGLIELNKVGREQFCLASAKPLEEVNQWLKFYEQFWDKSLDDLGSFLDQRT